MITSDELEEFSKSVTRSLSRLSQIEQSVIELRYGLSGEGPLSLDAVGKRLYLSRERIRQIATKAARKMRAYWNLFPEYSDLLFTERFCYPVSPSESSNRIDSFVIQNKPRRKVRIRSERRWRNKIKHQQAAWGWNSIVGKQKSIEIHISILGRIKKRLVHLGYKPDGKAMTNGLITLRTYQHSIEPSRIKLVATFHAGVIGNTKDHTLLR